MRRITLSMISAGALLATTPAHAAVDNVSAYGDSQSEGCAKAKNSARRLYGERITGFGSCHCSKRSDDGYLDYDCNVDVRYRDRD